MSLEQSDIDTIATLVEEYIGTLATRIQEIVTTFDRRIGALEHVSTQAIYRDFIVNEAVRLGVPLWHDPVVDHGQGEDHDDPPTP